jgi:hypothetical protein
MKKRQGKPWEKIPNLMLSCTPGTPYYNVSLDLLVSLSIRSHKYIHGTPSDQYPDQMTDYVLTA